MKARKNAENAVDSKKIHRRPLDEVREMRYNNNRDMHWRVILQNLGP